MGFEGYSSNATEVIELDTEGIEARTNFESVLLKLNTPLALFLKTLSREKLDLIDSLVFSPHNISHNEIRNIQDPDTTEKVSEMIATLVESDNPIDQKRLGEELAKIFNNL